MDKKHNPTTHWLQEIHFKHNDTGRVKVKEWKKIYRAKTNLKKLNFTLTRIAIIKRQ